MKIQGPLFLLLLALGLFCCSEKQTQKTLEEKIEAYFTSWNQYDFENPAFSEFKLDTSLIWHGTKKGKGIRSVFNPNSGWKQWDRSWNGTYTFKIQEMDLDSLKVTGAFTEITDFHKQIGMPEGLSATVSFWFNDDLKVKETLYAWDPNNKSMHELIKPMVAWAKVNDSLLIENIYLKDGFVPNFKNARAWKKLMNDYQLATETSHKEHEKK
ncbi:MAG: hypothetical protein AAF489_05025 [Bacteroidota bacterium]